MPKATLSYLFELKISKVANSLASQLIEGYNLDEANTFILIIKSPKDEIECIQLNDNDQYFELVGKVEQENASFIFFDHFDPYGYAYLKWNAISQAKMEELNGQPFVDSDFTHMRTKETGSYRESGSVMLG